MDWEKKRLKDVEIWRMRGDSKKMQERIVLAFVTSYCYFSTRCTPCKSSTIFPQCFMKFFRYSFTRKCYVGFISALESVHFSNIVHSSGLLLSKASWKG